MFAGIVMFSSKVYITGLC